MSITKGDVVLKAELFIQLPQPEENLLPFLASNQPIALLPVTVSTAKRKQIDLVYKKIKPKAGLAGKKTVIRFEATLGEKIDCEGREQRESIYNQTK